MASNEQDNCASSTGKLTLEQRIARIRDLNDRFRTTGLGGLITLTHGVSSLGAEAVRQIVDKVRTFTAFTNDNDPYGEHDMGSVQHDGHRIFWKIDYYDKTLDAGSNDPSNPEITTRVLTIMLVSEY